MNAVSKLISELKRRNVLKVVAAYAVAGFIILQLCDILFPAIGVADAVIGYVLIALILLAPPLAAFVWMFELTPDGLRRTREVSRADSISQFTGQRINHVIILLLSIALAFFANEYFSGTDVEPDSGTATVSADPVDSDAVSINEIVASPAMPLDTRPSIAVLPFVNMSSDKENEHFSDGLSEEILNLLAQSPELRVAGRTSAFFYKDKNENLTSIGEVLNVEHILEGSVRKSGNKVRITAQLISASDGFHLWSKTFDRELDDIFAVQDEIAGSVSKAMEVTLLSDGVMISDRSTTSPEAYDLYLRAKQALYDRGADNVQLSTRLFNQVIQLDPEYAPAYVDLAVAEMLLNWNYNRRTVEESLTNSKEALDQAKALGHETSDYWAALGLHYANYTAVDASKAAEADAAFEKAIAMNPNNVRAYMWWATHMSGSSTDADRNQKSLTLNEEARALDPLNRISNGNHANYLSAVGRQDEALALLERLVRIDPEYDFYQAARTQHYLAQYDFVKAAETLASVSVEVIQYPFLIRNIIEAFDDDKGALEAMGTIPMDHPSFEYVQLLEMANSATHAELQAEADVLLLKPDPDFFAVAIIFSLIEYGDYDLIRRLIENARIGFRAEQPPTGNANGYDPRWLYLTSIYKLGQRERARRYAEKLLETNSDVQRIGVFGKGISDATCYLVLGDNGRAYEELRKATEQGWLGYYYEIATDPLWLEFINQPEVTVIKTSVDEGLARQKPGTYRALAEQGLIPSV